MVVHELTSTEKAKRAQAVSIKSKKKKTTTTTKPPVFKAQNSNTNAAPKTGWSSTFYNIIQGWGVRNYQWTAITSTEDAVKKSQIHLIDMIRYFEGDAKNNYKAKMKYDDANHITTYGYGVVNLSKKLQEKHHIQIPPRSEQEAYKAMLVYMDEIAKNDVISRLGMSEPAKNREKVGKTLYNGLPQSVKEALLDFAFNNGASVLSKVNGLKKAVEEKDWAKVIDCLIWTKPNSGKIGNKKNEEMAGLYKRSLSRVILAAKGLPKSSAIEARIEKLYKDGVKQAIAENKSDKEFHLIYNEYKGITKTVSDSEKTNSDGTKLYRVNQEKMGIFSMARSMRPSNAGVNDLKGLLIAIMNEIVRLNSLKTDGYDENGYPRTALQTSGTTLKLPTTVKFEGKTIKLNAPAEMEYVTDSVKTPKQEPAKEVKKQDSVKNNTAVKDTAKTDTISAESSTTDEKEEKTDNSGWWKSGLIGAGVGLFAGLVKKASRLRIAGMLGLGIAAGLGVYGLIKLFTNKTDEPNDGFDPNDPNVTPFQRILHEKDIKISEKNRHSVKLNNGKETEIALQIIEKEYEVQPYSPENIETIWSIAKKHGVSRKELGEYNELKLTKNSDGIEDYHDIKAGQKLKIIKVGYKVEKGDTYDVIAEKFGISKEVLMDINNIFDDAAEVTPGTILEIPAYIHKVKHGETLSVLAEKAGISTKTLQRINNLENDKIKENQELIVVYTKNPDEKVISSKTVDGNKIETVEVGGDAALKKRPHLMHITYVNGKVAATRDEWTSSVKNGKLSGKTIILDAGHGYTLTGGTDIGAPGKGIDSEWLLNYDNVMRLRDKLLAHGAKVIYLQGSKPIIVDALKEKRNKGDFFISIHANSAAPSAKERTQIYYRDYKVNSKSKLNKENSKKFAKIAENRFNAKIPVISGTSPAEARLGQPSSDGTPEGRTGLLRDVLNNQNIPAVLWEVAFMSNDIGKQRLKSNETMEKYADIMCQSLLEYYGKI